MLRLRPRFAILSATLALAVASLSFAAVATDSDGDGIADETENATARVAVAVPYSEGTVRGVKMDSNSQGADPNDLIGLRYESGRVDAWYFANDSQAVPTVQFRVRFRELIEFRGPPVSEISGGDIVQRIALPEILDSVPIRNSTRTTGDGERVDVFEIGPQTGPFNMTLYVPKRFAKLEGNLVSPMEVKIDFHIRNFPIEAGTSVAMSWDLQTESDAHLDNTSHDERANWATGEREMNVSASGDHAMFFSWSDTATVDGVARSVITPAPVRIGGTTEGYLVYPSGAAIDHDPKIGARSDAFAAIVGRTPIPIPQGNLVLFLAALAAFSAIVVGTVVARRSRSRR